MCDLILLTNARARGKGDKYALVCSSWGDTDGYVERYVNKSKKGGRWKRTSSSRHLGANLVYAHSFNSLFRDAAIVGRDGRVM